MSEKLSKLRLSAEKDGIWRNYDLVSITSPVHIKIAEQNLINFTSTQYLALIWKDPIADGIRKIVNESPPPHLISSGSYYMGGYSDSQNYLEELVAHITKTEFAMGFSSGWAANFALAETCLKAFDLIISDTRNHNSIIKGLQGVKKTAVIIADLNHYDFEALLASVKDKRVCVIYPRLDGISGEEILPNISTSSRQKMFLICDEAHSFGLYGTKGVDEVATYPPDLRILGFSKGVGGIGSVVCGPRDFIKLIQQFGSPWMFSTPLPPYVWKINAFLFENMMAASKEREIICKNSDILTQELFKMGAAFTGNRHIIGLHLRGDKEAVFFENLARKNNIHLKVSIFPTRPKNKPVSRIALNPFHSIITIQPLYNLIAEYFRTRGAEPGAV